MTTSITRGALQAGVSCLALVGSFSAVPAFAQDAPSSPPAQDAASAKADASDIVVTARRKALQSATDRKRNSDTIIDSVVADEAGKLPDNSVTEVLQRVSGVTIVRFAALGDPDRFSAEGSGIQVRGLSGVTSTLNGRQIFGATGGGGISWGEVTPELFSAVDVFKASTADRIEGGTGGSIDLRTKLPFDYKKPSLAMSLAGAYGDAAKKGSYNGSLLLTDRWNTKFGEIGVLVDVAYSKYNSASSFLRLEPYYTRLYQGQLRNIPGGFDFGQETFERTRKGFYEALQWRPAANLTFFQTAFITKYQSNRTERSLFVNPGNQDANIVPLPLSGGAKFDSNGALISAANIGAAATGPRGGANTIGAGWVPADQQVDCTSTYGQQAQNTNWGGPAPTCSNSTLGFGSIASSGSTGSSENQTRDFSQGFTWDATDKLRVSGALQFVDSYARGSSLSASIQSSLNSYSIDTSGSLPTFGVVPSQPLTDRGQYQWTSLANPVDDNKGHMATGNLDLAYHLGDGFFKEIEVGGRYADFSERDNQLGTYWAPLGRGWNGSAQRTLNDGKPGDTEFYTFDDFFKGAAKVPTSIFIPSPALTGAPNAIYLQNTYGYPDQNNGAVPNPNGANNRRGLVETGVVTKAAYVQARFGSSGAFPISGNIGLRVVKTDVHSTGATTFNSSDFYLSQADANADLADGLTNNAIASITERSTGSASNSYTRWLPSLNVNYKPTNKLAIRAAVNETTSPPDFDSIRATSYASINTTNNANNVPDNPATEANETINYPAIFTGFNADRGNTKLKPTGSLNFDLSVEWYPSNNLNLHASGFHKILTGLILYGTTVSPFSRAFTRPDGTTGTASGTISTNQIYNAPQKSFISGVEVGGRKFFSELPAPFDGLGFEGNFTYIDSKSPSSLARDINGNVLSNIPIVGLSKFNFNATLLYERKKLSMRAAYSWRSRYLQSTNANGTTGSYLFFPNADGTGSRLVDFSLPVYAAAYGQLDGGITYSVNDHFKIYVQGSNLTNAITKTETGGYPGNAYLVRSYFVSDRRIEGGINISF